MGECPCDTRCCVSEIAVNAYIVQPGGALCQVINATFPENFVCVPRRAREKAPAPGARGPLCCEGSAAAVVAAAVVAAAAVIAAAAVVAAATAVAAPAVAAAAEQDDDQDDDPAAATAKTVRITHSQIPPMRCEAGCASVHHRQEAGGGVS